MSNEQLREFSEWLDTYRDLPVHEVFHEIVLRYEEALATTEPAVNQQLTTEPFDEREAFEKWLGIKPCGAAHDFGWAAWQARAAMAQVSDINVAESFTNDTKDAERYRCIRRGQRVSVINGIGDILRAESLDAAIDAEMAQGVKG